MKINNISFVTQNQNIKQTRTNPQNLVSFSGLKDPLTKCMFVFDLDGTLAHGSKTEINNVLDLAKKRSAQIIYATGRVFEEVVNLQDELTEKGITLPNPDFLVANNGQFLYKNIDGILVKDTDYEAFLKAQTNFDSKTVFPIIHKLATSDKYRFSNQDLRQIEKLTYGQISGNDPVLRNKNQAENCFNTIKSQDPLFYQSKISYYEWNHSEFMDEYFVGSGVNIEKFKAEIQAELEKVGIKTKFIENLYSKSQMDKRCKEPNLLQAHNLRRNQNGSISTLFLCPADKSDGVTYIQKQLNIPSNEILLAGNDENDFSLAKLAEKGAYFLCVKNSSQSLKDLCIKIYKNTKSVIFVTKEGAAGIAEGIRKVIRINSNKPIIE